jgi:hypothetical protein
VENEFSELPHEERMRIYRAHAMKSLKAAEASESKAAREHFLFIALQWEDLAKSVELKLAGSKTVPWVKPK